MKLSVALVSLLAAPAAAFSTGSYLDSLSNSNNRVMAPAVPEAQPIAPPAAIVNENESAGALPMIPQEPVLKALDTLDGNMNRIHDENMEALMQISSSFKTLAIRSKAKAQEERTERQLEDDLRIGTVYEEDVAAPKETPTAFIRQNEYY